jgi:hypothetical protein
LGPPVWESSPSFLGGHADASKTDLPMSLSATILEVLVEMLLVLVRCRFVVQHYISSMRRSNVRPPTSLSPCQELDDDGGHLWIGKCFEASGGSASCPPDAWPLDQARSGPLAHRPRQGISAAYPVSIATSPPHLSPMGCRTRSRGYPSTARHEDSRPDSAAATRHGDSRPDEAATAYLGGLPPPRL